MKLHHVGLAAVAALVAVCGVCAHVDSQTVHPAVMVAPPAQAPSVQGLRGMAAGGVRYDLLSIENDGAANNVYVLDYGLTESECEDARQALTPQQWRVAAACYSQAETSEIIRRLPHA